MEMVHDRRCIDLFAEVESGDWPPRNAYLAIATLLGEEEVAGSLAWIQEDSHEWHLLAVTKTRLVSVTSGDVAGGWSEQDSRTALELNAWARPLRDLHSIRVTRVEQTSRGGVTTASDSRWTVDLSLDVRDVGLIDLPRGTVAKSQGVRDRIETFVGAARDVGFGS